MLPSESSESNGRKLNLYWMRPAEYNLHAGKEQQEVLNQQWQAACENKSVDCAGCGVRRGIEIVYRCLYCGLWFCFRCAEEHFGKTFDESLKERRAACAKELKGLSVEQLRERIRQRHI